MAGVLDGGYNVVVTEVVGQVPAEGQRLFPLDEVTTAGRPLAANSTGRLLFDTTLGKPILAFGGMWIVADWGVV